MNITRLLRLLLPVLLALIAGTAGAQGYPDRPIRLLVGYPAGSAADFVARLVSQEMAKGLGQPIVVENRIGASGVLAATVAAQSAGDGYTLVITGPASVTTAQAIMGDRLKYRPEELVPVGLVGTTPLVLQVKADSGVRSLAEFVALAKATPQGLNIGSYGIGSPSHFAQAQFQLQTGLPLTHVPYNGSPAALTALLGGEIHASFETATAAAPHVASGKVLALAITTSSRSPLLPDVPTMREAGVAPVVAGGWAAIHAPPGTPAEVVKRLNDELNRALSVNEVRSRLGARLVVAGGPPEVLAEHARSERERLEKIIRDANLSFEMAR